MALPLPMFHDMYEFVRKSNKPYSQVVIGQHKDGLRLYQLLYECMQNPDTAAAVRSVVFGPRSSNRLHPPLGDGPRCNSPRKTDQEISREAMLKRTLKPLELGDEESEWIDALSGGCILPHQARYASILLLVVCPKIEHLAYEIDAWPDVVDFIRRNNYNRPSRQFLQNLRHVTVLPGPLMYGPESYKYSDPLASILSFHRHPRLESFSLQTIEDSLHDLRTVAAVPKTSNLKSIKITNSELSTISLAALIRMPRALESFTYKNGGEWTHKGGHTSFHARTVAKALWTQRTSLKELDLNCDSRHSFDPEGEASIEPEFDYAAGRELDPEQDEHVLLDRMVESGGPGPLCPSKLPNHGEYRCTLGSLNGFTSLKRLRIGAKLLLGQGAATGLPGRDIQREAPFRLVDALPQSLEYLQIRGFSAGQYFNWDEQIRGLLNHRASKLPNLHTIEGVATRIPSDLDIPRRKPCDPNHPRRALTSYFVYMQDTKPLIRQDHPDWSVEQLSEEGERRWRALTSDKKEKLEYRYNVDKVRYHLQMKFYERGKRPKEISFERAEALYKRYLQIETPELKKYKYGEGLEQAVEMGEDSEMDAKAIIRAVETKEEAKRQARKEEKLVTEGPDYHWVEVEGEADDNGWVEIGSQHM